MEMGRMVVAGDGRLLQLCLVEKDLPCGSGGGVMAAVVVVEEEWRRKRTAGQLSGTFFSEVP